MTQGAVELIVSPAVRDIWRPFYPGGAVAGAAAVWAVVASARGADDEALAALVIVLAALLHAGARTALWRVRPGRVLVTADDVAVHFHRGRRIVRSCPWAEVRGMQVSAASRWPEWSSWATFGTVTCVTGPWPHPDSVSSPEILLVRPEDLARAQAALDAAVRRYALDVNR